MIPYYSPNLGIGRLIFSLFQINAKNRCIDYYKKYTGKRYILLTSSCRNALFLTYSALTKRGKILASPLICTTALEPIIASGNRIYFSDISSYDMNMDISKLPKENEDNIIALQTTYFGGQPLDMDTILTYCKKLNLLLIEDCAQGFGSSYDGRNLGSFGDVACFSMIKTAYGISGGVLATNNKEIYEKAKYIQSTFNNSSVWLDYYRLVRNCIDTYRKTRIGNFFYNLLLAIRFQNTENRSSFRQSLKKANNISYKVFLSQVHRLKKLHKKRISVADSYVDMIGLSDIKTNYHKEDKYNTVPTKLFLYKKGFNAKLDIKRLNEQGIEAKHLQQKYQFYYQDSLNSLVYKNNDSLQECHIYLFFHDSIVSVPVYENMSKKKIEKILSEIKNKY